jgi:phosphopantothenoylcysteine decarboxylase/phosphopantothenate--cysteine ligase
MGYAIASAAAALGADTTLISGPTQLTAPAGARLINVETTDQMLKAVKEHFTDCDFLIMAAAPADFRPARPSGRKIKKHDSVTDLILEATPDILKSVTAHKMPHQIVVGFALETDNGVDNARKKLRDKRLDMIVLNRSDRKNRAFDADTNQVTLILPRRKPIELPTLSKEEVAMSILTEALKLA